MPTSFKGNVTATLGKDLAHQLGRKGTVSDVTLYNHKLQDTVLSFVEPSAYPDKIQPLVTALMMADQTLFRIDSVDAFFAETVVALDALGMARGWLILGEGVTRESIENLISGTVVSSYAAVGGQSAELREMLARLQPESGGKAVVQVDHAFNVRGAGTVVLGVVRRGVVRKHDNLIAYPQRTNAVVKSIQVHDTDVEEAAAGVRVGLALKDVKPEDVPRGSLLSTDESLETSGVLELDVGVSKYSPRGVGVGDVFMVGSCLNYIPAKVASGSVEAGGAGRVSLSLEKEMVFFGSRVVLLDPGQRKPRVFGHGLL